MEISSRFEICDHVESRRLGGELVILDLVQSTYFGLDEIGERAWQGLEQGQTIGDICEMICVDYDAEQSMVNTDVIKLIHQLLEASLIQAKVD